MAKILYPIGTRVLLATNKNHEKNRVTPLYVVEYRKGKKHPYGLALSPSSSTKTFLGHKFWSVKGIMNYDKWYNNTATTSQSKADAGVKSHPQETAQTPVKSLSAEEVQQIVSKAVKTAVDEVTTKLTQEFRSSLERTSKAIQMGNTLNTRQAITDLTLGEDQ